MDDELRRARRQASSGALDDQVALLVEQLRAGALTVDELRARAQARDPAARAAHRQQYAGARTYSDYTWRDDTLAQLFQGAPIHHFERTFLPGDRIVPIRHDHERGGLWIFGSVLLDELVPSATGAERNVQQLAAVVVEHPLRPRAAPRALLEAWRYRRTLGGQDRPLRPLEDGKLTRATYVQGRYLLTPETARAVVELLAAT